MADQKWLKAIGLKKEAVVIDVGINRITIEVDGETKNKLVGDVDFDEASTKCISNYSCSWRCWPNDYCNAFKKHFEGLFPF